MSKHSVHNHGPEEGPGLSCPESLIGDCIRNEQKTAPESDDRAPQKGQEHATEAHSVDEASETATTPPERCSHD